MRLAENGGYEESEKSPTFPQLPLAGFVEHLQRRGQIDETSLIREFRDWVRKNVVGANPDSPQ